MEKRKIIENRLDLTKEEVLAGMNFNAIKQNKLKYKFNIKSTVFVSAVLIILTVGLVIQFKPKRKPEQIIKTNLVTDSIDGALPIIENRVAKPAAMKEDNNKEVKSINNQTQTLTVTNQEAEENGYSDLDDPLLSKIVSFRERANSDVRYSIEIKDSIYGPTNVSKGYGDIKEYEDKSDPRLVEANSAWFKFTVKKDTLLTFHIVPKLKTDDYNIALFKCSGPSCMNEIARNKIKPIRVCFSWNTSHNCNTGLSSKQKDTTYMAQGIGVNVGPTYASALKVKAGETYYLLVNANSVNLQDPEGFTIYFYNYLPKNKTNTYIFKTK